MKHLALTALVLAMFSAAGVAQETAPVDKATLEKQLAESLSGGALVGYFTTDGKPESGLKEETYQLNEVKKLQNDYWLFSFTYGKEGKTIPLTLPIQWAGDTPVITLTDAMIPGMGTFTARVLFYRGHYAGTWDAGDHGGKLFGRIQSAGDAAPAPAKDAAPKKGKKKKNDA